MLDYVTQSEVLGKYETFSVFVCAVGRKGRTILTSSLPTQSAGTTHSTLWHEVNEQRYTDESFEASEVAKG